MPTNDIVSTLGIRSFISRKDLTPGKVVQFTYNGEQKYALVLNPEWDGKLHGLTLENIDVKKFIQIRNMVGTEIDSKTLYSKFKNSNLLTDRPYRTYLLSKISTLREIYIKEVLVEKKDVTENMYGE